MGRYDYKKKINYVRKPFAQKSVISCLTMLVSVLLCAVSIYLSVIHQGEGGLDIAAWAVSSMLFAVVSEVYGILSFYEDEKNYILSKIAMVLSGILLIFWICMVIVGIKVIK